MNHYKTPPERSLFSGACLKPFNSQNPLGQANFILRIVFTEQNISSVLYYFTRTPNSFCSLLSPLISGFSSNKKKAVLIVKCVMLKCLVSGEHLESLFSIPALANRTFSEDASVLYTHCASMVATSSAMM